MTSYVTYISHGETLFLSVIFVLIKKGSKESMIIFTALLTASEKRCCLAENGSHCSCKTLCSLCLEQEKEQKANVCDFMSNLVYSKTPAKQRFHYTDFWPAMEYHWQSEGARICLICSVGQLAVSYRKSQRSQAVATLLHEPFSLTN